MSIGQMNSPYSRPWLWPVSRPMIPSRNIRFQAQAHHDAESLAPHPARADEAREHVEERAEVHHRQPGEDHAAHVRRPDPAEAQPRDAAEGLRRDELRGEDEAEEVDDRQPEDRGQEPVARGSVREPATAARGLPVSGAGASTDREPGPVVVSASRALNISPSPRPRGREMTELSSAESCSCHPWLGYGRHGGAHPGDRGRASDPRVPRTRARVGGLCRRRRAQRSRGPQAGATRHVRPRPARSASAGHRRSAACCTS